MTFDRSNQRTRDHARQTQLLPAYVNSSLRDAERAELDRHLAECAACRADLALERELFAAMRVESPIEYVPRASLQRLRARIDGQPGPLDSPTSYRGIWLPRWLAATAASVILFAAVLASVVVERRELDHPTASAPYHTVTSPRPTVSGEVIRAVFAPSITLARLQALLDESQLRIVAGPTGAGVYSLASATSRPPAVSLQMLRQHAEVRFAESTRPDLGPAGTQ
jgi:anti-sigma factor RsiW